MKAITPPRPELQLLQLMDDVARASCLDAVYESALTCLQGALGVRRASVLLFDDAGVMRFVAAHGLSDAYRRAVEGHSPWPPDQTDAQPLLVADVARDHELAGYRDVLARERIAALAFIPLQFRNRLLGKFMLYYEHPHDFTDAEIAVARTIAGHVSFAIEHHRIEANLAERLHCERTARRRAERESGIRRAIEDSMVAGVTATDVDGTQSYANPAFCEMVGFGREELVGARPPFVYWPDEERAPIEEAFRRTLEGDVPPGGFELRFCRRDGERFDVLVLVSPLLGESGRHLGWLAVVYDITERKRRELANEFLADAASIIAESLDAETCLKRLAHFAVPQLADWCAIHVTGKDGEVVPVELVHSCPEKTELAWQIVRRWPTRADSEVGAAAAVRTGRSTLISRVSHDLLRGVAQDEEHLRLVGQLGLHSALVVPLRARGRAVGAVTLVTAESKRCFGPEELTLVEELASRAAFAIDNAQLYREAQTARLEAERAATQVRILAEASDELATTLDPERMLERLAAVAVGAMGDYAVAYALEEGKIRRVGLTHRDPRKTPLVEALDRAGSPTLDDAFGAGAVLRSGEPTLAPTVDDELLERACLNAEHLRVLRELQPCSTIVVPLQTRGRSVGALAIVASYDSGRHYTEDDLRFAQTLATRAAILVDNARLYREAEKAVRARDEMAAIVSHDLRSPLNTITMAAELLGRDLSPERTKRRRASIRRAVEQMNRLIRDLLDISLIENKALSLDIESVDVRSLIAEAHSLFRPLAEARHIRVVQDIPDEGFAVRGDRSRLLQVLSNLLSNAIDHVPPRGRVTIRAERLPNAVRISVEDDGPGIPEGALPRLFERFWQGDRRSRNGAGLGLAIAKGVIDAHGGRIAAENRPEGGARFFFSLPPAGAALASVHHPSSAARSILVVDDDDAFRCELMDVLATRGHAVAGAANGREGLDYLRSHEPPAVLLLDLNMPVMDGRALRNELLTRPEWASIPVVLLSAVADLRAEAKALQVPDWLEKPVDLDRLYRLLQGHP